MSRTLERKLKVASGVFDPGSGCRACRRAAEAQEYCPGQRSVSDLRHGREMRGMGTRGSAQNVADDAGEPAEGRVGSAGRPRMNLQREWENGKQRTSERHKAERRTAYVMLAILSQFQLFPVVFHYFKMFPIIS